MTSISWRNGPEIVAVQSLHEKDVITFSASNHLYRLKLKKLKNILIGQDRALFQLWPATDEMDNLQSELETTVKYLIASLTQLKGAKYVRNGREYPEEEALMHLMVIWQMYESSIKKPEDFITIVASESSASGQPYVIRMSDGSEMKTEEWFVRQLELRNKDPEKWMKKIEASIDKRSNDEMK